MLDDMEEGWSRGMVGGLAFDNSQTKTDEIDLKRLDSRSQLRR